MGVIYHHVAGSRLILSKAYAARQDRYGLFSARCTYTADPETALRSLPKKYDKHPIFPWLELETFDLNPNGAFVNIESEYFGIKGQSTEKVYELSNGAGEFPIEYHPNFPAICQAAGLTEDKYLDKDGHFTGFPVQRVTGGSKGEDYPSGKNLSGVEAFLGFGEVHWSCRYNTRTAPSNSELNKVGKIDTPDGNPPSMKGRDWILMSHPYSQKGKTFTVTKEWKLSGPHGANTDIYGASSGL